VTLPRERGGLLLRLALAGVPHAHLAGSDEALVQEETELAVQVNGKRRFQIEVAADASEDEIRQALTSQPDFARHTAGMTVQRIVIVPGRIANIVAS